MTVGDDAQRIVARAVARLRAVVVAIVCGFAGGVGLAVATLWLLVRGGEDVGGHLSLLGNYFPGYSVTWPGVLIGFVYGALAGMVAGGAMAWIYNLVVDLRFPAGPSR